MGTLLVTILVGLVIGVVVGGLIIMLATRVVGGFMPSFVASCTMNAPIRMHTTMTINRVSNPVTMLSPR